MYKVSFESEIKEFNYPFEPSNSLYFADLERALAVASMLGKVSTPEVQFGVIKVEPIIIKENETSKKETY